MAKILVAEDEPDIQEMLVFMLEREGYTVIAAGNGEEAYRFAQADHPDLVLMDVRMPHVDGYAATRLIRGHPVLYNVPVIFVSVRSLPADQEVERAAGGSGHVNKPFAPETLLQQVREALGRGHSDIMPGT
jgi:CheY-like chemotaxis protein